MRGDIFAVLGNHDSIAMVPDLEEMGCHSAAGPDADRRYIVDTIGVGGVKDRRRFTVIMKRPRRMIAIQRSRLHPVLARPT